MEQERMAKTLVKKKAPTLNDMKGKKQNGGKAYKGSKRGNMKNCKGNKRNNTNYIKKNYNLK